MRTIPARKYVRVMLKGVVWAAGIYLAVLILYVVNNLIWFDRLIDFGHIREKARLRALETRMPSLPLLTNLNEQPLDAVFRRRVRGWVDYFEKAAAVTPYPEDSFAWQGYCYYLLGQPVNAAGAYQKAVQINPLYFWFHHGLGMVYYANQQYEQAARSFADARQPNPYLTLSNMREYITVTPVLILWRWPPLSADEHMQRNNRLLRQGYADGNRYLALSQFQSGDYAAVVETSLQAVQMRDTDKSFFYVLAGMAAAQMDMFPQALGFLTQGLEEHSHDPRVLSYLERTFRALGQAEEAEIVSQRIAQLKPGDKTDILSETAPEMIVF